MFEQRLRKLHEDGFRPQVIYDIGAHEGSWTKLAEKVFPEAECVLFEGDLAKTPFLRGRNAHMHILSDKDNEQVVFHKTKGPISTGNSILKELSNHYQGDKLLTEMRQTKTLDTLVKEQSLPMPDLIKLDTQGSEMKILMGAKNTLKNTQVVVSECSLHQYNEKAPLIAEFLEFMKTQSFVMFDIGELHHCQNVLVQIDIFFCRPDAPFFRKNFYAETSSLFPNLRK